MANRILTTHVGSLPRPAAYRAQPSAHPWPRLDEATFAEELRLRWEIWCASRKRPGSTSSTTASTATRWARTTITAHGGHM